MRSLHLAIDRFADVVQQSAALGNGVVDSELHGHQCRELRDFERMNEHVLPVGRPIAEAAQELEDLGVDVGDPE